MKKILLSIFVVLFCIACDPVEDRDEMTGHVTAEQLNVTATPLVVNGKNSNKIILENRSPILSKWDYGLGVTTKAYDEVLMVVPGQSKITFIGRNGDGTEVTKELTVQVDELSFEVPKEWALFCGAGEKTWTWDDTAEAVFGNGGYLSDTQPAWWKVSLDDVEEQGAGEGKGAEMTFSTAGATFTKKRNNGTSEVGSFSFDMTPTMDAGGSNIWASGNLTTKGTTILAAISPDDSDGPVYETHILTLTENKMILSQASKAERWGWATAHYWVFKAK